MSDLSYTVDVKTGGAVNSLKKVDTQVKSLNDTFGKLKTAIAGLATGALITGMNNYARGVKQASDATGVAITTVNDFASAVATLGGNANIATGDVIDFVAGLKEAKDGSAGAQIQLAQVGISLQDLAELSNQDLFQKTVKGLAAIEDASIRNALAVKLLGKSFKDVDIKQVAGGMSMGGGASASAITAAADATKALSANFFTFQSALLKVLEPLNNFIKDISVSITAMESLIKVVAYAVGAYLLWTKAVGAVTGTLNLLEKALIGTKGMMTLITGSFSAGYAAVLKFKTRLTETGKIVSALGKGPFAILLQGIFQLITGFGTLLRIIFRLGSVVGILMSVGEAVDFVVKKFFGFSILDPIKQKMMNLYEVTKKWLGLGETKQGSQAEVRRIDNQIAAQEAMAAAAAKVVDANRGQKLDAEKIARAYEAQSNELQRQLQFQNSLIGMDETAAARKTKMFELETNYLNEINQLRTKYVDLQAAAAVGTEEEKNAFASFAAVMGSTVGAIATEYDKQRASVSGLISDNEVLLSKEKDRQNIIDSITQQMERQGTLGDQIRIANEKMNEALFEGAQLRKSPMEQQLDKIMRDATEMGRQAGQNFAAGFDSMDMSVDQANELGKGLEQITKAYENIGLQQQKNLKINAMVGEGMTSIMQNMNSAIDNFVTTGKFKFGDFARSVIQDLLKIELRAQASKLFSSISGGIFGFLGSLFGGSYANGGQPPVGKPSIVGENGPELFVPKTAGTIVPNGGGSSGAGGGNTYITNNITAMDAKSVAQLFAENRKALFGTVELARKEVSYGVR